MTSGLTEAASAVIAPSMTPVPGTIMRAPKSWPIDSAQAAAPPFSSIAARPEKPPESAGTPAAGAG